ncbi:ubiquitin-activating E1 FCCH domain-containing protein [Meridianimarinicoccus sp. RP-17]|uniref:ubiquitin-activating E1 FCCH domain-containing protein n=1 Tax=Meridianimarinicoccus zhengii TaxID=2056810 RepID=UPI000DAB7796|nr:ubiquitin-activating E1 FCCH domain-containing protein [Phycocomes zhengii]
MTVETFDLSPIYTISGTGPYAIEHPYRAAEDIEVSLVDDGAITPLASGEFSVEPAGPVDFGIVTLSADAATAFAGKMLRIDRNTEKEQGFVGATSREKGMERQLDAMVMAIQENAERVRRALVVQRGNGITPEIPPIEAGHTLIATEGGGFAQGPNAADIEGANTFGPIAKAAAIAAAASEAQAKLSAAEAAQNAALADVARTQAELAAVAAGATLYASVADGLADTTDGDVFLVAMLPGVQVHSNDGGSDVLLGWLGDTRFDDFATMNAYPAALPVGTMIQLRNSRWAYEVVSEDEDFTTDGGLKLKVPILTFDAFGPPADGTSDDVPALNRFIAAINRRGDPARTAYKMVEAFVPAGVYNVRAGGIDPILISNVTINCSMAAQFVLRDGSVWICGTDAQFIENVNILGGYPRVSIGDTAGSVAWVEGTNVARVFVMKTQFRNLPHIFRAIVTGTLSGVRLINMYGTGQPQYDLVKIDTTAASVGSALYLNDVNGYPEGVPSNPAIVPSAITGATRTNPVAITSVGHGFQTGRRVRIGGVAGMTELNGNSYIITVVNADTFTLNDTDGTGFNAYTSGGWAAELHWSFAFGTSVVNIKGKWDTAVIKDCTLQHWAWLWKLHATGPMSFIYDLHNIWDYAGDGRMRMTFEGGSIGNVEVKGGWHFCLNNDWLFTDKISTGALLALTCEGQMIGMSGRGIVADAAKDHILDVQFKDCKIVALGRARLNNCVAFDFGAAIRINVSSISMSSDEGVNTLWGTGADEYLVPDIGVRLATLNRPYYIIGNTVNAKVTHYSLPDENSFTVGRTVRANTCTDGSLPEYYETSSKAMPVSGATTVNATPYIQTINLRNGGAGATITSVLKNGTQIFGEVSHVSFDVAPGETWSAIYSGGTPVLVISVRD